MAVGVVRPIPPAAPLRTTPCTARGRAEPQCAGAARRGSMHVAFVPEMVCPKQASKRKLQDRLSGRGDNAVSVPFDPFLWSKEGCHNRRYMLPGIACNVSGQGPAPPAAPRASAASAWLRAAARGPSRAA